MPKDKVLPSPDNSTKSESARDLFASNIRRLMSEQNFTQKSLAAVSGVPQSAISMITNTKLFCVPKRVEMLADALGVEIMDLYRQPAEEK